MRPRIRTLKPEIWADEAIGRLDYFERLLYVGLITMADDEGRLLARPTSIAGHIFPHDRVGAGRLRRALGRLHGHGLIVSYEHDGVPYVQVAGWKKHQKINRPTPSSLPAATAEQNGHLFAPDSVSVQ